MADEGEKAQLQSRIKELEDQLLEAQQRTQQVETAAFDSPKLSPPEAQQTSSEDSRSESSKAPPQPAAPQGQPPYYPMFQPQFYPMNYMQGQMGYPGMMQGQMMGSPMMQGGMQPGPMPQSQMQHPMMSGPAMMQGMMPGMMPNPMAQSAAFQSPMLQPPMMPMMSMMPPQYPSYEQPYWPQRPPEPRPRTSDLPSPELTELKAELAKVKDTYEDQIKDKDDEIDQLRQALQDRPSEPIDITLQRKVQSAEEEAAFAKKEMELARDYIDKLKAQVEERDKAMRQRLLELETENRGLRDRNEKLDSALNTEKHKLASANEKLGQMEEQFEDLQERFVGTVKDLEELKRSRLQYSQKYQNDQDTLKREVKSLNNALEQANLQLDQAKFDLQNSERRARVNGQQHTNVEINRLTQQVHLLQRQLETTSDNYAKFVAVQSRPELSRLSPGRVQEVQSFSARQSMDYSRDYDRAKALKPRVTIQEPERDQDWSLRKARSTESPPDHYEWPSSVRSASEGLERELVLLQQEKQQLDSEYLKLPERARTVVGRKRREEVEGRLKAIDTHMASLKGQLRGLKVLRKS